MAGQGPWKTRAMGNGSRSAGAPYSCVTRVTQEYGGPVDSLCRSTRDRWARTPPTGPSYSCVTRVTQEQAAPAQRDLCLVARLVAHPLAPYGHSTSGDWEGAKALAGKITIF